MLARLAVRLVRPTPPPLWRGIAAGAVLIVVEMLLILLLGGLVSQEVLEGFFLLGVLAISTIWGLRLAVAMAVVSVVAYNVGYVEPVRHLDTTSRQEWAELVAFLVGALLAGLMGEVARVRAVEAVQRQEEADLFGGLARFTLAAPDLRSVLLEAERRTARTLRLTFATIERDSVPAGERQQALPLRYGSRTGTLLVPAGLPDSLLRRLDERVVPQLEVLLQTATEREAMARAVRALAAEQAGLRRVAELVAHGAPPADVVAAVAAETAALLDADATRLLRLDAPDTFSVIAEYTKSGIAPLLGRQFAVEGGVMQVVLRTARPARVDSYEHSTAALADLARKEGLRSVAAPIMVEGRVWGALAVLWAGGEPAPPDTESRLAEFTELVATAVANTESRAELSASRTRIVLAADEARRRLERDLHDGVQQRMVSLGLELRAAEALLPDDPDGAKARLNRTTEGLASAFKDLQEISRGLHPAILSQGGLMPALRTLARRAPLPVTINLGPRHQLPSGVEVAAYYVVSEALTNVAKHAHASKIDVDVTIARNDHAEHDTLVLSIRDNGVGGADPALGSGLAGLVDRVEALGGHLRISSPAGAGTTLLATLPAGANHTSPA